MKKEFLFEAINGIDDKLVEEATFISPNIKKTHKYYYICAVAVASVAITSIYLINNMRINNNNSLIGGSSSEQIETIGKTLTISGGGYTLDEITNLIETNKDNIAYSVALQYQAFGKEIQIFTKGYSHVTLSENCKIDIDYLTLPICIENRIVGNIEVFKSDGEIQYTLNLGGTKWDEINKAMEYSDNIAFAFTSNGYSEIAIAPDNTIFNITELGQTKIDVNYNDILDDYITFSISDLTNTENYISVLVQK